MEQVALVCPNCSAPLEYEGGSAPTILCRYCGTPVVVPNELRQTYRGYWPTPPPFSYTHKRLTVVVLLVAFSIPLIVKVIILSRKPAPSWAVRPSAAPKSETTSFASQVLEFGSGWHLKDARCVGVDGSGNIYVGEYLQSRVLVFDPTGKFTSQLTAGPQMKIQRMAVDRKGGIYILANGAIWRFDGASGKELGHFDCPGPGAFNDITVTPDGGLVASETGISDSIIRYDEAGRITLIIQKPVSTQSKTAAWELRVAVDAAGNIYALSSLSDLSIAVYKFSVDGKYITRFGREGDSA